MSSSKIVKELYRSNNKLQILFNLKKLKYRDALRKFRQSTKHPFAKNVIFQNGYLPKNIESLRGGRIFPDSENIEGEIAWCITILEKYVNEINEFINFENQFQRYILKGKYKLAEDILNRIDNEVCISYWSIENRFSVKQKMNGTDANWEYLNTINKKSTSNYSQVFFQYFSIKTEIETSTRQYNRYIDRYYNLTNISNKEKEYILFKLGYHKYGNFAYLSAILNYESISSVIDIYIMLLNICIELTETDGGYKLIEYIIEDLNNIGISDYRLLRLCEILPYKPINNFNQEILELFDFYSKGFYSEAKELAVDLMDAYPECLELYEIYIKCFIELGLEFDKTNISPMIDSVLEKLFDLYSLNSNYSESKDNLIKEYLNFSNITFFKQLLALVLQLTVRKISISKNMSYFIFSRYSNPQVIHWVHSTIPTKFKQDDFENHISIRINDYINNANIEGVVNENISSWKKTLYTIRIQEKTNNLNISFIQNLLNDSKIVNFYKHELIIYLNKAYIRDKKIVDLIKLVVNSYFYNTNFVEKIDVHSIVSDIIDNNYSIEEISINLPLIFYINNVTDYYLYVALELYLNSLTIEKPSQITGDLSEKEKFLLEKICTVEVLNNFYLVYNNDEDVINERISILRMLASLNENSQMEYFEEIANLTQKIKTKKTLRNINSGKIVLNFARLKEDKNFNIRNSFNRFLKVKNFTNQNELLLFDRNLKYDSLLENSSKGALQEAAFVSFKAMFYEVVDNFLFSKEHGLDGDLSTRIRHGVLENQIRSVFKNLNIISTKNSEGEYQDINYWSLSLADSNDSIMYDTHIQYFLKEFSKSIDNIIKTIRNEFIQIQSNNHSNNTNALFNFRLADENLFTIYTQITETVQDYEAFINYVFSILSKLTNDSLKKVKAFFENSVNHEFQNLLNKLEDNLKDNLPKETTLSDALQKINIARTNIEKELLEISKWFNITEEIYTGALDMTTIIETAFESININRIQEKLIPKIEVNDTVFYERGYYYIDIFKILISNSINHSLLDSDKLDIQISVANNIINDKDVNKLLVEIVFTNKLSKKINRTELAEKLNNVRLTWNSDFNKNVNIEGGSGFQKIKRILMYDLRCQESHMDYALGDEDITISISAILIGKLFNI